MRREPIGTGRLPSPGGCQPPISSSIGVDLPIPEKPTSPVREGSRLVVGSPLRNGIQGSSRVAIDRPSGSLFAASGRNCSSTPAWGSSLRRQTRRLEVVRRSLPRSVSALLPCRIRGLLRLYLLQYCRQPLIVDDRAGLHCLDLVEHLETKRCSVKLNREPRTARPGNSRPPPSCALSHGPARSGRSATLSGCSARSGCA